MKTNTFSYLKPTSGRILILAILFLIVPYFSSSIKAQDYTLNWSSSFSPVWANATTTRTATNIGSSGINCGITMVRTGGTWGLANLTSGAPTPTVSGGIHTVGTFAPGNNLMLAVDYSANNQSTLVTFTFTEPVQNVNFLVGDIDKLGPTSDDFIDELVITGNNGTINPTFTKYFNDPTYPNFLVFSGNTVRANPAANAASNAGSDAGTHSGTVNVSFQSNLITSFSIRYQNAAGTQSNPVIQSISLGHINFSRAILLQQDVENFIGSSAPDKTTLEWKAYNTGALKCFVVEGSYDGKSFSEVGRVNAATEFKKDCYYFDSEINAPKYFYRLKIVDVTGTYSYSKVITVVTETAGFTLNKVYPTSFKDAVNVELTSIKNTDVRISLVSLKGETIYSKLHHTYPGMNRLLINTTERLLPGYYQLVIHNGNSVQSQLIFKE